MSNPPSYLGIARLAQELDLSENTIEEWVRLGLLPAPRKRRAKRLWKWREVEEYLDRDMPGGAGSADAEADRIREATRAASAKSH